MNWNTKMTKWVDKILVVLISGSFFVLIFACVLQVFTRFVLNSSLSWTEELARYAFIWSNLLGAALCVKNKSNAVVTVITDKLSVKNKKRFNVMANMCVVFISCIIAIYGLQVAYAVRTQLSPALRLPMSFVYGAAPAFGLLSLFYGVENMVEELQGNAGEVEK